MSQKEMLDLQTILCGMGELHIEIIHDRIRREYGIETHLGPLQVAYRETVLREVSTTGYISYIHFTEEKNIYFDTPIS